MQHKRVDGETRKSRPSGHASLESLLEDKHLPDSTRSDLQALVDDIFPYISQRLHLDTDALWREIGRSKLRRLVPLLRAIAHPDHQPPNSVAVQLTRCQQLAKAHGDDLAKWLLDTASDREMTFVKLNAMLNPSKLLTLHGMSLGGMVTLTMSEDDYEQLKRLLGAKVDLDVSQPNQSS